MNFDTPRQISENWSIIDGLRNWAFWCADEVQANGGLMQWRRKHCPVKMPEKSDVEESMRRMYQFAVQCSNTIEVRCPKVSIDGAQDGEDAILAELLPASGTYLDIGAGEPQECSNTWQLYRRGWRGLLVDPLPWRIPLLALHRPGDAICPVAIMDYDGYVTIRVAGSCSSAVPTWNIQEQGTLLAPCFTLSTLLDRYPSSASADYVSIDVEGSEGRVLAAFPWDRLQPAVISVEHVEYNPDAVGQDLSGDWAHHLTDHGYVEHARTRFNIIYRREA